MKTQRKDIVDAVTSGKLVRSHRVTVFTLFGKLYTSNKRRKTLYSFDDKSWQVDEQTKYRLLYKLHLMLSKQVRCLGKFKTKDTRILHD